MQCCGMSAGESTPQYAAYHVKGVVALAEHWKVSVMTSKMEREKERDIRNGHSSPGNLHLEHVLS